MLSIKGSDNADCIIASGDELEDDGKGGSLGGKPGPFVRAASVRFSHSKMNPASPFSRASRGGKVKISANVPSKKTTADAFNKFSKAVDKRLSTSQDRCSVDKEPESAANPVNSVASPTLITDCTNNNMTSATLPKKDRGPVLTEKVPEMESEVSKLSSMESEEEWL